MNSLLRKKNKSLAVYQDGKNLHDSGKIKIEGFERMDVKSTFRWKKVALLRLF